MATMLKKPRAFALIAAGFLAAVCMAGCPNNDPDPGTVEPVERPNSTVKINKNGQRVVMTSWSEQGVDSRVAMGYELEDGTLFYDNVVQLYGIRPTDRDCSKDDKKDYCNRAGFHLCFDSLIYNRNYRRYNETIKPVREKGIKYLINFCPGPVPIGIFYRWPMGEAAVKADGEYKWETIVGGAYPYRKEAVDNILDHLKEIYDATPFDGLAFDEEYGSGFATGIIKGVSTKLSGYPETSMYPGINTSAGWRIEGENLLRFAHECNVKIFGKDYDRFDSSKIEMIKDWVVEDEETGEEIPELSKKYSFTEEDKRAMEQGAKRLIWEAYEIRAGGIIPESYTYPDDPSDPSYNEDFAGMTIYRDELIDCTYNSNYGGQGNTGLPNWPRNRYGSTSVDLGFNPVKPKPGPKSDGGSGIIPRMEEIERRNYGVVMFYHIVPMSYVWDRHGDEYYGPNKTPLEDYLSDISKILFDGQMVRYIGTVDYPEETWGKW
jgi:hypothetical protein